MPEKIHAGDRFDRNVDALNALGTRTKQGTPYQVWRSGGLEINDGRYVAFLNFFEAAHTRWHNEYSDADNGHKRITEFCKKGRILDLWVKRVENAKDSPVECLFFGKFNPKKPEYVFMGNFQLVDHDFNQEQPMLIWERIAIEAPVIE